MRGIMQNEEMQRQLNQVLNQTVENIQSGFFRMRLHITAMLDQIEAESRDQATPPPPEEEERG